MSIKYNASQTEYRDGVWLIPNNNISQDEINNFKKMFEDCGWEVKPFGINEKCEYCQPNSFKTLIKSEKIGSLIYWIASKSGGITKDDISDCEYENSVVFEIRNGGGYIRLGDPSDMGCIDHSENFEVNFCPMCGRKLR